ncbi:hypothetical protein [Nocardia sp. NPDC047038]|uniref:hypothetical protein n=1 Tax=Nocardia sp. NPDC047038 TaxID=3154338 RepID=UPI0033EEF326
MKPCTVIDLREMFATSSTVGACVPGTFQPSVSPTKMRESRSGRGGDWSFATVRRAHGALQEVVSEHTAHDAGAFGTASRRGCEVVHPRSAG